MTESVAEKENKRFVLCCPGSENVVQVKNPQRDLPLGIALALGTCSILYMMVSSVIVGVVPYSLMDPDTPMSSAFSNNGMPWAMYVVKLCKTGSPSLSLMPSCDVKKCPRCADIIMKTSGLHLHALKLSVALFMWACIYWMCYSSSAASLVVFLRKFCLMLELIRFAWLCFRYIVTAGAVAALSTTLMGSILPQVWPT